MNTTLTTARRRARSKSFCASRPTPETGTGRTSRSPTSMIRGTTPISTAIRVSAAPSISGHTVPTAHRVAKATTPISPTGTDLKTRARTQARRRARQAGFSLVELMVVMLIVALLFAVVGVSVSRSVRGAEIRNAAREVIAGIRPTRGQAIIQRQAKTFDVDADARSWTAANREPVQLPDGLHITQIGRASCRGRGYSSGVASERGGKRVS